MEDQEDKDVLILSAFAKATKWLRSYFSEVQATKVPPLSTLSRNFVKVEP